MKKELARDHATIQGKPSRITLSLSLTLQGRYIMAKSAFVSAKFLAIAGFATLANMGVLWVVANG